MIYLLSLLSLLTLAGVLIVLLCTLLVLYQITRIRQSLLAMIGSLIALEGITSAHTQHALAVSNALQALSGAIKEALSGWYAIVPKHERLN